MSQGEEPRYSVTSTDSHVVEPPDLWTGRIEAGYRDRAPRLVPEEDADWWYIDDLRLSSVGAGVDAGTRFEDQRRMRLSGRFSEVRPGGYDPEARLKEMDADGIACDVLYPSIVISFWRLQDSGLLGAILRAYNDWLAEFCRASPKRLVGLATILLDDIDEGIAELRRAAAMGLRGAVISVYPGSAAPYSHPQYEDFWAAAQDLDMPLSFHISTNRTMQGGEENVSDTANLQLRILNTPTQYSTISYWVQLSIADMIFSGVFERFPNLKVISVEHEASWAAPLLQAMDYTYTQRALRKSWQRFRGADLPSDFFHRNVFVSFQEDALAIRLRDVIGVGSLVWGSDYPHAESTFPHSQAVLREVFSGVPESEVRQILEDNPRRLYGIR